MVNDTESRPISEFTTPDIISNFHEKWVRLSGCDSQYDVYLRHIHNNEFEIQFLYRHYIETKEDASVVLSFDKVLFASPIISRFLIDSNNLSIYKEILTDKIGPADKMLKKEFQLKLPIKDNPKNITFDFAIQADEIDRNFLSLPYSVEVKSLFCFACTSGDSFSLDDILMLEKLVNDFLSFTHFEQLNVTAEISMLSKPNESGNSEVYKLYCADKGEIINRIRPVINYSDLKTKNMKAIMQGLLDGSIYTHLLFPICRGMVCNIDILRYCGAIEREVGLNKEYKAVTVKKIKKDIGYDVLKRKLDEHGKKVIEDYRSDFDSAVSVFKKFNGSLASKLKFAHELLLSYYDEKPQEGSHLYVNNNNFLCRIKKLRHGLAHALVEQKELLWQSRDADILQAMLYMLILARLKVPKLAIKNICVKAFSDLGILLYKQQYTK